MDELLVCEWDALDDLPGDRIMRSSIRVSLVLVRIVNFFVGFFFIRGCGFGLDLERCEVRKTVGIEFSVCKRITVMLVKVLLTTWNYSHDDAAIDSDFDVTAAHVFTKSKGFVCLVMVTMIMLK